MKKRILKLYENDVIRYIFWGGCTTLVNLVSFYIMRELGIILMAANVVSIILAIRPFLKFVSARLVTMVIEVGGVWLLAVVLGFHDMVAKFCTQFIVLVLNYIFSKFIIFTTGKKTGGSK